MIRRHMVMGERYRVRVSPRLVAVEKHLENACFILIERAPGDAEAIATWHGRDGFAAFHAPILEVMPWSE